MLISRDAESTGAGKATSSISPIEELHRRCGIYTMPKTVEQILDAVGWRSDADLRDSALLEPSAGDGAFVVEAARRLVVASIRFGIKPTLKNLRSRIVAFELYAPETRKARVRVAAALVSMGLRRSTAVACSRTWIRTGDFLLADLKGLRITHAVGNPPYVRWSRIPHPLRNLYSKVLPRDMTHGDLFVPFLDKALRVLVVKGYCGFLCSDRWKYMGFAEAFRNKWIGQLKFLSDLKTTVADAYLKNVGAYPDILLAQKQAISNQRRRLVDKVTIATTLADLGCTIRVGPALGHSAAFVLEKDEGGVEKALLFRWIDSSEIQDGRLNWRGRQIAVPYDQEGKLVDIDRYPLFRDRLSRFREALTARSIVARGAIWYRTIDRIRPMDWNRPKLLVPELSKIPRIAIDHSGAIPSHGVYAIFAPNDDVESIYAKLANGRLAKALEGIAPRVNAGYVRCYKRFLQGSPGTELEFAL